MDIPVRRSDSTMHIPVCCTSVGQECPTYKSFHERPMQHSLFRKASIANGLLILTSSLLGWFDPTRWCGIALGIFMGLGLMFSGLTGFCGWVRIFSVGRRVSITGRWVCNHDGVSWIPSWRSFDAHTERTGAGTLE